MIKEELYRWLHLDRPTEESGSPYPPGYCHFPKYGEEYFKQITAEQLVTELQPRDVSRATIYRTLDLLVELGFIQRIPLAEGCHSYAGAARVHGHHLVCSLCGRAEEFADCDLDPMMNALQAKTGFTIDIHMLELVGRCPQCQASA